MAARELKPCGTHAAYRRHIAHGEDPCEACLEAEREYKRNRRAEKGSKPRGELRPCGTTAAYERHVYHGEVPCDACLDAWADYQLNFRFDEADS